MDLKNTKIFFFIFPTKKQELNHLYISHSFSYLGNDLKVNPST